MAQVRRRRGPARPGPRRSSPPSRFPAHRVLSRSDPGDVRRISARLSVRFRCRSPSMVTSRIRCGEFPAARCGRTVPGNHAGPGLPWSLSTSLKGIIVSAFSGSFGWIRRPSRGVPWPPSGRGGDRLRPPCPPPVHRVRGHRPAPKLRQLGHRRGPVRSAVHPDLAAARSPPPRHAQGGAAGVPGRRRWTAAAPCRRWQ